MNTLAPAHEHVEALSALFAAVEAEGVMELDATRESTNVAQDRRNARARKSGPTRRWAILDEDDKVVGYLSGQIQSATEGTSGPIAFVSLVVVSQDARRDGHGWRAILEFVKLAVADKGAQTVRLQLDETGDVAERRARFERMGFEFDGLIGTARINELLSEAGEPR